MRKGEKYWKKPIVVTAYQTDKPISIETLEGTLKADPGDYIITGVKGEKYLCKPDVFEATYEKNLEWEEIREELRQRGEEFVEAIGEEVDRCVLLCDAERLSGLITTVNVYLGYRVIHGLREKGLGEELRKLCERAGKEA